MPQEPPPTETADTTPPPSFFDSEFNKRFSSALQQDGKIPKVEDPPPASPEAEPKAAQEPVAAKATTPAVAPELPKQDIKPVDQKPDEDAPPASIKSTKAAEDWKRMKQEHKNRENTLASKIKELEGEIGTLRSQPKTEVNQEEIAALKREHEAMSEQLRILDVERHPRFQAYFNDKINNALAMAKQAVGGAMADKVTTILQLPESDYKKEQLRGLFSELDEFQQEDVKEANRQIRATMFERETEKKKATENYQKVQQERQKEEVAFRDSFLNAVQTTLKQASDKQNGLAVFQERDGDDAWNGDVQNRRNAAQKFVESTISGKISPEQLALGATWMVAAEPLLKNAVALAKENEQLRAKLEELRSAVPNAADGDAKPPTPVEEKSTGNYFDDALSRAKRELSGKM